MGYILKLTIIHQIHNIMIALTHLIVSINTTALNSLGESLPKYAIYSSNISLVEYTFDAILLTKRIRLLRKL